MDISKINEIMASRGYSNFVGAIFQDWEFVKDEVLLPNRKIGSGNGTSHIYLLEDNMTIFLTTHYMEEAAKASHIAVIDGGVIKEYGTPFSLKERYAKDKLKMIPKTECAESLQNRLADMGLAFKQKEEYLVVALPDSLAALPILDKVREQLEGFEMVQGSMDDVFLNVTGKTLEV